MIYSLIFNSDLIEYGLYGYEIDKLVILSLINQNINQRIGISRGDLLLISSFSNIHSIRFNKRQLSYSKKPDVDIIYHMISELYYSIKKSIYWIKDDFEVFSLVKNNYYINTIYNLKDDQILDLNNNLKSMNSYIGFFKLDQDNSLHIDLFYNKLIKDIFIYKNKIYYKSYHDDPMACEPVWAKSHEINYSAIDELEFDEYFPRNLEVKVISDQDKKIAKILNQSESPFTFLIKTLFRQIMENKNDTIDFSFNNDEEFTFDKIVIPREKIEQYILNNDHSTGKNKAIIFNQKLGIKKKNSYFLIAQIKEGLLKEPPEKVRITTYGIQYDVSIQIKGINDENLTICTAWIIDQEKNIKLTTAYVLEKTKQKNKKLNEIYYIDPKEKDYYSKIFNLAEQEAKKGSNDHIPTPLYIDGIKEPISDGLCGDAYLEFDRRTRFFKWASKNNVFQIDNNRYYSPLKTQSFELNEVYIEIMYRIFKINNIKCEIKKYYS